MILRTCLKKGRKNYTCTHAHTPISSVLMCTDVAANIPTLRTYETELEGQEFTVILSYIVSLKLA